MGDVRYFSNMLLCNTSDYHLDSSLFWKIKMNQEVYLEKCDSCGRLGALDFMGEYFCQDCLSVQEQEDFSEKIKGKK